MDCDQTNLEDKVLSENFPQTVPIVRGADIPASPYSFLLSSVDVRSPASK
ncbi:hypothetical protein CsSME_00053603 [Camellia sinensis var. sinensis]